VRYGLRAVDQRPQWTREDESVPAAEVVGSELALAADTELRRGIALPVQVYPVFEQALRIAAGRPMEEHLVSISELWARFSAVAAANPHAWSRAPRTAEEIRTPGPDNRWIGWPYPKLMNSNNMVDQGAAVILCSAAAADRLGVARDRWVFPLAGTDAHDTSAVTERGALHRSPAIRIAGARALALAGVNVDDVVLVDLYSCFPSAVQVAANELGLGLDDPARPLTVTGGLSFAGGPWNDYVTHAIATMATSLRASSPGTVGLVTANGGFLTKHAIGLYGTEPPAAGFRWEDVQAVVDQEPATVGVAAHEGPATIEAWTVMHDRAGDPETGIVAARTPDGARTWAVARSPDVLLALLTADVAGATATVDRGGTLHL